MEIRLPTTEELTQRLIEQASVDLLAGTEYRDGIQEAIVEAVVARFNDKIDATISEIVERHLETPTPQTNEFGEPTGETVTLRQRIAKRVEAWLGEKVDRDGGPGSRYGSSEMATRMDWAITRAVYGRTMEEIQQAVRTAADETRARLTAMTRDMVAETIARLLNLPK